MGMIVGSVGVVERFLPAEMRMDEASRLLNVLRRAPVDRAPFICPGGMMNMVVAELMDASSSSWPEAHVDAEKMARLALAANRLAGVENVGVPFCMTVEAEALGAPVELGGRTTEPKIAAYPLEALSEVDRLAPMEVTRRRPAVCVEALRILKREAPETPAIANLTGPVSLATSLIDPQIFYRAVINDKDGAHALMRAAEEALLAFGGAMAEAGADVVCIADPSASGEILGRKPFAEFALPYINRLADSLRQSYGIPAIVHICGNVGCLGPLLSEISAEALSVDSLVSIRKLKELAPAKVAMGNVSTYLLAKGKPEVVRQNGRRCLRVGSDILAPGCGLSPTTPLANIRSLSRAARGTD
jgi:[methyl-Co(III) methanol-specific corrinoid protein]:coenzyme M methyltransferase